MVLKKLSGFLAGSVPPLVAGSAQPGVSYAAAASSIPLSEVSHEPSVVPLMSSQRNASVDDCSCNVILFGLPGGKSLVESKKVVDEILDFLSGQPVQIRDMFCLGKYVHPLPFPPIHVLF